MANFQFRVSKYDPALRNGQGHFTADEWTSSSDIGKSVTAEEYARVEQSYIDSALRFLREQSIESLRLDGLENRRRHKIPGVPLREGRVIAAGQLAVVMRGILREKFWARLSRPGAFVHFGYDHYMYVGLPALPGGGRERSVCGG